VLAVYVLSAAILSVRGLPVARSALLAGL